MGFWDKEELIGTVTKNKRGVVYQVRVCEKSKRTYLDIRTMYPSEDGELLPGKGIAIPIELAPEVAALVNAAITKAVPATNRKPIREEALETIVREVL